MADTSGLPPIGAPATNTGTNADADANSTQTALIDLPPDSIELSPKEYMIGGGALLLLAIIFFFVRNAYVNYLVGSLKRSPNNAGLAGWCLFGGLLFGSAIGCGALLGKSFPSPLYWAPLGLLSLISFIFSIVVSSKR
jgi:hypothetical protein